MQGSCRTPRRPLRRYELNRSKRRASAATVPIAKDVKWGKMTPMKLFESELRVIEAAEELAATLGEEKNHTVAAAAMDAYGTIYRAVNVYHFTVAHAQSWL